MQNTTTKKRTFDEIQAINAACKVVKKHLTKGERISKAVFLESAGYGEKMTSCLISFETYQADGTKEREIWISVWRNQRADNIGKIQAELHDTLF